MTQPIKKTTCEKKGHAWQSTTSPLIRRCFRTGCGAMEHCINGVWQESHPRPVKPVTTPVAQQADLWA